ncbi:MAG: hypothetical protein Q7N50_06545 [Armatimonadota bacterium]|nr:hypothetical protein [Armatimonadota bacterium]
MDSVFEIAELIRRLGKVKGRVRLQKIVYLLQQKGCQFGEDFEYGHYGPYSRTLALELDVLKLNKLVEETKEKTTSGVLYTYKPNAELEKLMLDTPGLHHLDDPDIHNTLALLKGKDTHVLEVASSRLFLSKNGLSGEKLDQALEQWKPGLRKYFRDGASLLKELELEKQV